MNRDDIIIRIFAYVFFVLLLIGINAGVEFYKHRYQHIASLSIKIDDAKMKIDSIKAEQR